MVKDTIVYKLHIFRMIYVVIYPKSIAFILSEFYQKLWLGKACIAASSLAKVPIRFPPLPLGGFRQVYKLSVNMRLTSFASYMLVLVSLVMYKFAWIYQRSTGWAYDEVLTTYKPYSTLIFDANDVKTCLNPPRGRGGKRIGTLASEDGIAVTIVSWHADEIWLYLVLLYYFLSCPMEYKCGRTDRQCMPYNHFSLIFRALTVG